MEVKTEQVYLGDVISSDGKHSKNIQARKNKSLGVNSNNADIANSVYWEMICTMTVVYVISEHHFYLKYT